MQNSNLTVRYDISAKYLSVVIIIPMEPEDVHPYFADGVVKVAEGKDKLSTLKAAREMLTRNIQNISEDELSEDSIS